MKKYVRGFVVGMCAEYMYRVEASIYPALIIGLIVTMAVVEYVAERKGYVG